MSELHNPPGTFILSKLHDVTVPASVSWYPQTIGWKILALVLVLALLYVAYRVLKKWWVNRYRKEALDAIFQINSNDSDMPKTLFTVLKVVLVHLDSRSAKLFDNAFLRKLDELNPKKQAFSDETSALWLKSIINPKIELSHDQRVALIDKATDWVKQHEQVTRLSRLSPVTRADKGDRYE